VCNESAATGSSEEPNVWETCDGGGGGASLAAGNRVIMRNGTTAH